MHPDLPSSIYQALLADKRAPTGKLHCSSHSHWPLRFTQLSQVIDTEETDFGALMTMKLGTLTHEWLERYLGQPGALGDDWALSEAEYDVTRFLPDGWTGTLDYLVRHKTTNTLAVIDVKTIKPEAVAWLGNNPKPEHTTQVSCYHAAITKAIQGGMVTTRSKLQDEIVVVYVPKGKTAKQETVEPVIKTAPAEPSAWANMVGIKRQVDQYVAEFELTGDPLNRFLAPMPLPEPRVSWNKAQNSWDVVMRPSWTEEYIGVQFGDLCPRTPSQKIGTWNLNGSWVPRKGVSQPDYDSIPRPSQQEVERRRGVV